MRSGPRLHVFLAAFAVVGVVAGGIGVPQVQADAVDQQRQRVNAIADDLDNLENRIGQLDEDHAAALDRIDQLTTEIEVAQAKVDAQQATLTQLQSQLSSIALDKFMSGGAVGGTPLLGSAATVTDDLQRGELSRVALDQGAGSSDDMQALVADLTDEAKDLQDKKDEQAALSASLETRQQQGQALADQYQAEYAAAQAELGDLVAQEEERRAQAAVAQAQAQVKAAQQQAQAKAAQAARGGGVAQAPAKPASSSTPATPATPVTPAATGGGNTNAGSGGGGASAPDPTVPATPDPPAEPSAPPVSSLSGIAVAAASSQLGVPYKFAAESPGVAFDCSGLTKYAWGKAGVYIPHQSAQQYASTPHVPKDQAQPGDLIFYYSPIGHVAIYIGNNQLIHAPAPGKFVMIAAVNWNKVVGVSRPG